MSADFDTKMEIIGRMLDRRKEQQSDLDLLNAMSGTSIELNCNGAKDLMFAVLDSEDFERLDKLDMAARAAQAVQS
jgi:hypothetical protein